MTNFNEHWNNIFSTKEERELGWYESDSSQTFRFLNSLCLTTPATVFLAGVGISHLVDELLQKGNNLILNDISDEALRKLKKRVSDSEERVTWLHADIAKPLPDTVPQIDIWVDRAVLHFLLDERDIDGYFENVHSLVKSGGYVLLAEFSTNSVAKCAGLDLHLYSVEEMVERMGGGFDCVQHEEYTYTTPFGAPRPFIYALFRRK